jgi:hypothetical protein
MGAPVVSRLRQTEMQEPNLARIISIVRRPGELVALISEPNAEDPKSFEIKSTLDALSRSLFPRKARLQESWQRLANVTAADSDTLYDVLIVAIESVPDLSLATTPPPLPINWGAVPATPKATSAHPRAFKGTKRQPPKGPRSAPLDIRPHLCHPGSMHALLSPMRTHLPEVQARLEQHGYSRAIVEAIESEFPRVANVRQPVSRAYWTMAARFVQCIWPLVRWRPARDVSAYLSLYVALELESDDHLLRAVSRFIALSDTGHACAWCRLATTLPPHRRLPFVGVLSEVKPDATPPGSRIETRLAQISELSADEQFPTWVRCFLEAVRDGGDVDYLMAGFRLAAQFVSDYPFGTVGACKDFPEQDVEEIGIALADQPGGDWLPMTLWERCGQFPGMGDVIGKSVWLSLTPDAAYRYFRFLIAIAYTDVPEAAQLKWQVLRKHAKRLEGLLTSAPSAYQTKAAGYFSDWLWTWDEPDVIGKRMPFVLDLVRRLATLPFKTGDGAASSLCAMLETKDSTSLKRFLTAPNRSFESIERACRRDNDATLISGGLEALLHHLEAFTVQAFCTSPTRLMRAARMLGGVSRPVRTEISRMCVEHPLFQLDPMATPIKETCSKIWASGGDKYVNPIPARLRSWCQGEIQLSAGSLERYQRVLADRICLTRLGLIEDLVIDRLKLGLPVQAVTKDSRHALRLLGAASANRRGLRSFLNAYWSGDRGYLSKHPATLAWYRKHRVIPRAMWERGIPYGADHGGFTIQIERDPLEILKLGTYAGTCLGVGGGFSYSAIAALLDINKQVLYARDQRGRVIARQLLAIADDDRLVCFSVYPLSSSSAVKAAFRDYDRALAHAMGISLYTPADGDDAGYQVSSVLSVYWWDDYSWDFDTDQ